MHTDFAQFPIQAIEASLANLVPVGGGIKWPHEAGVRFLELVAEKELVAIVSTVDHEVTNQLSGYVIVNINHLTPNDHYSGRTTPLTSKCCILYIYSTNIGTEYFKHDIYSPFFPLQNAVCFINLTYLVPVLFTFYVQGVLKCKKIIPPPKG